MTATNTLQLHSLVSYDLVREALDSNFRYAEDDAKNSYIESRLQPEYIAGIKNPNGTAFRQGEVLLKMFEGSLEDNGISLKGWELSKDYILVKTTHTHELVPLNNKSEILLYKKPGNEEMYLVVKGDGVAFIHEEHHTHIIPAGSYLVQTQQMFDPLTQLVQAVAD